MKKFKFNKKTNNLFKAILSLNSVTEAEQFFRDLCTIDEIKSMSERWKIVQLLNANMTYRDIANKLNCVNKEKNWRNSGNSMEIRTQFKPIYSKI